MQEEIDAYNFLESGEHNGHLYGTHLDSVRDIIKEGNIIVWKMTNSAFKSVIVKLPVCCFLFRL